MTKALSPKKFWDDNWNSHETVNLRIKNKLYSFLKGKVFVEKNQQFLIEICKKYFPKNRKIKILEIGCAPAIFLAQIGTMFGIQVFGVEYSESGFELSKESFAENNLPIKNLIKADFFDQNFQKKYSGKFDVVFSRGFIEHFDNPGEVVKQHIKLLRPGGLVLVSIPNFFSFNGRVLNLFDPELLPLHNTKIMQLTEFKKLFPQALKIKYCDYFGWFDFNFFHGSSRVKKMTLRFLQICQRILWPIPSIFIKKNNWGKISSQLLYIGQKK
jgi:2-polyprenyl-3-methyl-5-hydroxy-6-metoxy-1,4-benzoquinol methylase